MRILCDFGASNMHVHHRSLNFSSALGHNSGEYLHLLIEATRLSFADAMQHVADSTQSNVPVEEMLNKDYASKRRGLITDRYEDLNDTLNNLIKLSHAGKGSRRQ